MLAALGTAVAPLAGASTAPTWMHAQLGLTLPEHDEKTDAVLLYAETVLTVQPAGKIRRLERRAFKILRPDGEGRGTVRINFDAQTRITDLHAWCIPSEGKDYEVKAKEAVESAVIGVEGGELIGDARTMLLRIPAAEPGNIVGYEYEQEERPYFLDDDWDFQETIPVRDAHFTLQLPPGWVYQATWLNHEAIAPVAEAGGRWRWAVSDVKAIKLEENMPPWRGVAARMELTLIPPGAQSQGAPSWRDFGAWYWNLTHGRREANAEIRQQVAALTANVPGVLEKIQALAGFVQKDIRYVAIELGIGGYQPRPATDVFAHRYGDCKDKATLLSSMLQEIGIESYYVIINTQRGAVTAATPPNLGFNHVILAIRLPADVEDPSLLALTSQPKLGRMLFFDPTDALTPLGSLYGMLQANYGVLVTPEGGELLQLPQLPAETNGIRRAAQLTLDENGVLRGEVHEIRVGDQARSQRATLGSTTHDVDWIKPVESVLAGSFATFRILKATVGNARAPHKPFEWNYSLEAEHYANVAGDLLLVRPRVLGSKARGFLETRDTRQNPIEFEGPQLDSDTFDIALPAGYVVDEIPPPVSAEYEFGSYHSKTEVLGHTLRYTRTLQIRELSVPASKSEELKGFYRVIFGDERKAAVLRAIAAPH